MSPVYAMCAMPAGKKTEGATLIFDVIKYYYCLYKSEIGRRLLYLSVKFLFVNLYFAFLAQSYFSLRAR